MKGGWVKVAVEPHVCRTPGGGLFGFQPKPTGSIWRCEECGKDWRVDDDNNYAGSGWTWTEIGKWDGT